jgi:hypothetical protein
MNGVRIERLTDAHFEPVASLFGRVFRRRPRAELLKRKYDTSHTGIRHVSYVAMEGGNAVAFVGMLPQLFALEGRTVLAAQACDYATDPAYRRRGLFRELERRGRDTAVDHGIELVWAWPHDQSLAVSLRSGWSLLETARRTSILVRTVPLARAAFLSRATWSAYSRWARREVSRAFPPADGRPNSLAAEGWLCQRYDAGLERYRCFTTNFRVDLGGVTAWLRIGPQLFVGDLDAPDPASVAASVATLTNLARRIGVQEVMFMTYPGTRLDAALAGILPGTPAWVGAVAETKIPLEQFRVNLADYDTF